jgi:hypothetical protein
MTSTSQRACAEVPEITRGARLPIWGLGGVPLLGAGLWALLRDVPRWNAVWYVPAWYGYLTILDAVLYLRRGRSFVSHDRRTLLLMLLWSVPFWLFFEASNLVLRNWYYVFGLRDPWAAAVMTAVAFATVLPACFFHAELLESFGVLQRPSCRPRRIAPRVPEAFEGFGVACLVLPLLFPRYTFPLIWFAPIGLDGHNYRSGAPSLLGDLEKGDCGRIVRLLLGGLWAGGVWELFNSWARCKWIYAVPGFETNKLFEMPLAGFLGFPVLAVAAFCFFSAVCRIDRRPAPVRGLVAAGAVLFSVAVYFPMQDRTVRSRRPLLSELSSLDAAALGRLAAADIPIPERLARAIRREGVEGLSARTGISADRLRLAREESVLALHKGMGVPRARLLEAAGIRRLGQLALEDPNDLWRRLRDLSTSLGLDPPRLPEVRVWVRAASRSRGDVPER